LLLPKGAKMVPKSIQNALVKGIEVVAQDFSENINGKLYGHIL